MIDRLPQLVNADDALVRRGRFLTTSFLVEVGDVPWLVTIRDGRVERVERGPLLLRSWTFAVRAAADAWQRFWQPVPEPGYHDLFAMTKLGVARIEGDLQPLMANLRYVKEVLEAPRRLSATPSPAGDAGPHPTGAPARGVVLEPITGRYIRLDIAGRPHRVYYEEAGHGIPLLCLHTAGSDSRQFRHLMTDDAVTRHHRVIAFDMPGHGKSTPPPGWHDEEYRLTTRGYMDLVLAVSRALGLDRPIGLGCSIGGRIVLHLAMEHAAEFRALIGLEAADAQQPWYDTTWLHRPDVHGGEVSAALVSGLCSPTSPAETRWETLWTYLVSGPGIFKGDLYFYRVDSDLRGRTAAIDAARCPLYLLTGEYDFSCTPEDTVRTAKSIPGARVTVMQGLGHFPMSEDPAQFRRYIVPVLEEIRARSGHGP
jgi:pimeloyl-ACP methyl ester carboxylesterase